jgi:hypothetical protein
MNPNPKARLQGKSANISLVVKAEENINKEFI